jgi:hypothetical protein
VGQRTTEGSGTFILVFPDNIEGCSRVTRFIIELPLLLECFLL